MVTMAMMINEDANDGYDVNNGDDKLGKTKRGLNRLACTFKWVVLAVCSTFTMQ